MERHTSSSITRTGSATNWPWRSPGSGLFFEGDEGGIGAAQAAGQLERDVAQAPHAEVRFALDQIEKRGPLNYQEDAGLRGHRAGGAGRAVQEREFPEDLSTADRGDRQALLFEKNIDLS